MAEKLRTYVVEVGRKLGRSSADVEPFYDTLTANWFDTPESLEEVVDDDLVKLGIPLRFAKDLLAHVEQMKDRKGPTSAVAKRAPGNGKQSKAARASSSHHEEPAEASRTGGKAKGKDGNNKSDSKSRSRAEEASKAPPRSSDRRGPGSHQDSDRYIEFIPMDVEDTDPRFSWAKRIIGEHGRNVEHVRKQTGAHVGVVTDRDHKTGRESPNSVYIKVSSNDSGSFEQAKAMLYDLVQAVYEDYDTWMREQEGSGPARSSGGSSEAGSRSSSSRKGKGKGAKGKQKHSERSKWHDRRGDRPGSGPPRVPDRREDSYAYSSSKRSRRS